MADLFDPSRAQIGLAGIAGATVYGLYQIAALILSRQPVTRADLIRAVVNVVAAVVAGFITAWIMADPLAASMPWPSLRDAHLVGFALGATAWEVMPFVLAELKRRARTESRRLGGGDDQ